MKDLGPLRYYVGIGVASLPKGYLYTNEIIHLARLIDDKFVDSPSELHAKFLASDGVPSMILPCIVS